MSDPKPDEFVEFLDLLTENAPEDYRPWLFRVKPDSKAPATEYGSWKHQESRLSKDEAVDWMESGGNVGIAGRPDDPLINLDIDDEDQTTIDDLKQTLIARSRSRTGVHAWYFEAPGADIPNIPTDAAGEVRANWQYVVAPGSYVDTDPDNVPVDQRESAGYYTVERANTVTSIRLEELPQVFRDQNEPDPENQEILTPDDPATPPNSDGSESSLFNVTARDIVQKEGGSTEPDDRWSALFHGSDTGENMMLSSDGLLHCWRHEVAHNGLQALSVLSDYSRNCQEVGAGHKDSGVGISCLHREDGRHIWHAWKYAKRNGYIPDDDPVPYSAIKHLCRERELCPVSEIPNEYDPDEEDGRLPAYAYDAAIVSIKGHDDLNPARTTTDGFSETNEGGSSEENATRNQAEADGGATAQQLSSPSATDPDGIVALKPGTILDRAMADHTVGIERPGEDEDPPTLRDLRDGEKAHSTWQVMERTGDDRYVLAVTNGQLYTYDDGVWYNDGEQHLREIGGQALGGAYSGNVLNELKEQVRMHRPYAPEELGAPDGTVATPSGLLDLRDRDTEPLEPDHLAVRKINASYDTEADCPRWHEFLEESIRSDKDRAKFQEYAGYCLWHHAQPFGKALFLVGPTDSGKGTALKTIQAVLGIENIAQETLFDLMQGRWGAAELYGNMANIRNEVTPGGLKRVERFKELTGGGDRISAEFKGKDKFQFIVTQKFLFATNQVPSIEHADEAFYNRLLFVKFPTTVPEDEQNETLLEELKEERSGILNWMLDGLNRLLDQSGFSGERGTGGKKEICDAFGGVMDRFKHSFLEVTGEDTDVVVKSDLYDLANAYAKYLDKEPEWNQQQGFTRQLKNEAGIDDSQTAQLTGENVRVYTGLRVEEKAINTLETEVRHGRISDDPVETTQQSLD